MGLVTDALHLPGIQRLECRVSALGTQRHAKALLTTGVDTHGDYSWYRASTKGPTQPVRQKKPNAWGVHDTPNPPAYKSNHLGLRVACPVQTRAAKGER